MSDSPKTPVQRSSWIITYADMVTLLLTFFVLILVMSSEAQNNIYRVVNLLLQDTENKLSEFVKTNRLSDYLHVTRGTKGVQLTISGEYFFDINSAEITSQLRPILDNVGSTIQQSKLLSIETDKDFRKFYNVLKRNRQTLNVEIRVEGHTDNWVVRGGPYANNWELSSARALKVVEYISAVSDIPEGKFSALGYGEFRPISDNDTEEGRSKNRRVEIFIDADIAKTNGT